MLTLPTYLPIAWLQKNWLARFDYKLNEEDACVVVLIF